ncbi:MAG: cytochrome c maturation protein CcmE [Rickettsiales bacterium]|nr:cytochrome c maturation protein CcmE [Rickettsiales bacterium]
MLYKKKRNRLIIVTAILVLVTCACIFVLQNIRNNIVFFYTPTEIHQGLIDRNKTLRIGGLVKPGSISKQYKDHEVITQFTITDCTNEVQIIFNKTLPNLFREKQGIVALGHFNNNIFIASELLIKHSEVYTPPNSDTITSREAYCEQSKK